MFHGAAVDRRRSGSEFAIPSVTQLLAASPWRSHFSRQSCYVRHSHCEGSGTRIGGGFAGRASLRAQRSYASAVCFVAALALVIASVSHLFCLSNRRPRRLPRSRPRPCDSFGHRRWMGCPRDCAHPPQSSRTRATRFPVPWWTSCSSIRSRRRNCGGGRRAISRHTRLTVQRTSSGRVEYESGPDLGGPLFEACLVSASGRTRRCSTSRRSDHQPVLSVIDASS